MSATRTAPAVAVAAITIRPEYGDDHTALARLAALDSAEAIPPAPLLLAEVDGELRAALSLTDGSVIADPFAPTAALLALLRQAARPPARPRRLARPAAGPARGRLLRSRA
jgi:hypothetical protein